MTAPTKTLAKPTLRLCTAGSVDDGKSTFVGRLLHDTKSILADQYESVQRVSTAKGLENPDLSLLVDGLRAEREQGITIDVAYRYFATDNRSFILADTPGHVQYTRNTVTGLSTSDLVIILVDARNGVLEQTRRHLTVAAMMKLPRVIVAVNKIDAVAYSQQTFDAVAADIHELATQLELEHVDIVPTSALLGDNVVERSQNTPWYSGPSVLEILEEVELGVEDKGDFRFPIQIVIRDHATDYRGYAGRVTAGAIAVGDEVRAAGLPALIAGIDGPEGEQQTAQRGESVTLRLDRDIDASRGDLIAVNAPAATNNFTATVFHLSETPLKVGGNAYLRHGAAVVRARVDSIDSRLDVSRPDISGQDRGADEVAHGAADELALNDIATVTITTAEPLPVEPYQRGGRVGSVLLIHPSTGDTITAGLIGEQPEPAAEEGWDF